jgi:hypothetical protein
MNLFLLSLFIIKSYASSVCLNANVNPHNQNDCDNATPSNSNFKCVFFEGQCLEMTECEANNYLSETEPGLTPQQEIRRRMSTICSGATEDDGFLECVKKENKCVEVIKKCSLISLSSNSNYLKEIEEICENAKASEGYECLVNSEKKGCVESKLVGGYITFTKVLRLLGLLLLI